MVVIATPAAHHAAKLTTSTFELTPFHVRNVTVQLWQVGNLN